MWQKNSDRQKHHSRPQSDWASDRRSTLWATATLNQPHWTGGKKYLLGPSTSKSSEPRAPHFASSAKRLVHRPCAAPSWWRRVAQVDPGSSVTFPLRSMEHQITSRSSRGSNGALHVGRSREDRSLVIGDDFESAGEISRRPKRGFISGAMPKSAQRKQFPNSAINSSRAYSLRSCQSTG